MGVLQLALLGRPLIHHVGVPLTGWVLHKSLALLAYLVVTNAPHSRGALAGLLWAALDEPAARANLRKVIAELRGFLPEHFLIARDEVAFDAASAYRLDVRAFTRALEAGDGCPGAPVSQDEAAALAGVVDLYRGDFLAGLELRDAPAFEQWVLLEREHLARLAQQALCTLVDYHAAGERSAQALDYLDRLLLLEPAHEQAHRRKMLLLVLVGQRAAGLRQYDACCRALQALDAQPDPATRALYDHIRAGDGLALPVHLSEFWGESPAC